MCNKYTVKNGHKCYIQTVSDPGNKEPSRFVFFDFETRQDDVMGANNYGNIYKHHVNCCVAYRVCDTCKDKNTNDCDVCGKKMHIFMGENSLDEFGKFLFSAENRGATALAHYSKGFDSQFVLDYIHKQKTVVPNVVMKGKNILRFFSILFLTKFFSQA